MKWFQEWRLRRLLRLGWEVVSTLADDERRIYWLENERRPYQIRIEVEW